MPVCAIFCRVLCLVIVPGLSPRPVQPAASPACWHKLTEELPVTLAPPIALIIPAMFIMKILWSHINLRWQLCSVSHLTPYRYLALLIRMLILIISSNFLYDYNFNTYTSFLQKSTYKASFFKSLLISTIYNIYLKRKTMFYSPIFKKVSKYAKRKNVIISKSNLQEHLYFQSNSSSMV